MRDEIQLVAVEKSSPDKLASVAILSIEGFFRRHHVGQILVRDFKGCGCERGENFANANLAFLGLREIRCR